MDKTGTGLKISKRKQKKVSNQITFRNLAYHFFILQFSHQKNNDFFIQVNYLS